MVELLSVLLPVIGASVLLLSWGRLVQRWRAGRELVDWEPRQPVPWGLIDFLIAFILPSLIVVLTLQLAAWGRRAGWWTAESQAGESLTRWSLFVQSAASLVGVALSALTIWLRFGARASDLGWNGRQAWRDVRLGVSAFVILAPPTYALQVLLVQLVESRHPLLQLVQKDHSAVLLTVAILSAVVVAPIYEEYLFRGLLQGWLERLATTRDDAVQLLLGRLRPMSHSRDAVGSPSSPPGSVNADAGQPAVESDPVAVSAWHGDRPVWPIFVSALVFAAMHITHGPDAIPLFVLAVGLGYLYRQTHRLLPSIVVHSLLNAVSMALFLVEVFRTTSS